MSYKKDIIIKDHPLHLAESGASLFMKTAQESTRRKHRFSVAVSGGSTPRDMHRLLATEYFSKKVPWSNAYIFWVDERCVPFDDKNSNYGAMREDLIKKVPIPQSQVHPMFVENNSEESAGKYRDVLADFFQTNRDEFPVFDLVFLGIGTDGHTASLFPGQPALEEEESPIVAVEGGTPNVPRMTMTYPIINNAESIVFLASGKNKAEVVKMIIEEKDMSLPASRVIPKHGRLIWLLDKDAADLLSWRNNYE